MKSFVRLSAGAVSPGKQKAHDMLRTTVCLLLTLFAPVVIAENVDPSAYMEVASELIDPPFSLMVVESDGAVADATFVSLSKNKPSKQSKQLARLLRQAANKPVKLVAAGESSLKTAEVLRAALKIVQGRKLPHLEVVFIGNPVHRERLEEMTRAVQGEFHFAEMDSLQAD